MPQPVTLNEKEEVIVSRLRVAALEASLNVENLGKRFQQEMQQAQIDAQNKHRALQQHLEGLGKKFGFTSGAVNWDWDTLTFSEIKPPQPPTLGTPAPVTAGPLGPELPAPVSGANGPAEPRVKRGKRVPSVSGQVLDGPTSAVPSIQ
jgi:hypothetical protein